MIATVTKRFVSFGPLELTAGTEIEVHNDNREGSKVQIEYTDNDGMTHVVYDIDANWLANIVVYRRAKDLGY